MLSGQIGEYVSIQISPSQSPTLETAPIAEFMYAGTPRLGWLLTLRPGKLFLLLFSAAALLLFVPAVLIGVASIPLTNGMNAGILYKLNWSLVYLLLFPGVFATASSLAPLMRDRLLDLVRPDFKVIQT